VVTLDCISTGDILLLQRIRIPDAKCGVLWGKQNRATEHSSNFHQNMDVVKKVENKKSKVIAKLITNKPLFFWCCHLSTQMYEAINAGLVLNANSIISPGNWK
jgi:hypothetical protein